MTIGGLGEVRGHFVAATRLLVGERDVHQGGTDSHRKLPLGQRVQLPAMSVPAPHFHLRSEASASSGVDQPAGRWRFILQSADGQARAEAEDDEPETSTERLQLLAIVRGLESLDEPARVTLVAPGRSISRGIRYGVAQWREDDWQWERYGKLTPVKNGDLWRRIDRAMAIHEVVCRELPAETDDLDGSSSTRSVREEALEPADVRVVHCTHRGRRLRVDNVGVARVGATGSPRRAFARQPGVRRPAGLLDGLAHCLARLLQPVFRRSRPPVFDHFT